MITRPGAFHFGDSTSHPPQNQTFQQHLSSFQHHLHIQLLSPSSSFQHHIHIQLLSPSSSFLSTSLTQLSLSSSHSTSLTFFLIPASYSHPTPLTFFLIILNRIPIDLMIEICVLILSHPNT
uniref:Uncharacterized protein n=1 Tax=Cacopsylla melanoneura TaxID=428564 RepID=A0A8D8R9X8_9HEMI